MNEDQVWLQQLHAHLEEQIQRSRLSFTIMQDERSSISGLWNDACAKEMNTRFLNPMAEDVIASIDCLKSQHSKLLGCANGLIKAFQSFGQADEACMLVHENVKESTAIFASVESCLNQSAGEIRCADSSVLRVNQLLNNAISTGDSAVSQASYRR